MDSLRNEFPIEFHIVDVFAEDVFSGNPLAVVVYRGELSSDRMLAIASEMNYSETTFIRPAPEDDGEYPLRIFTPARELSFAGHPILGTAWVIRHRLAATALDTIRLRLPVGVVHARFQTTQDNHELVWFAAPRVTPGRECSIECISSALRLSPEDIDCDTPVQEFSAGVAAILVPVKTLDALRRCHLDLDAFAPLRRADFSPLVYVFCRQTYHAQDDFCARFFFEALGVREDPAAGNATAFLGAYLLEHHCIPDAGCLLRIEQGYEIARPSLLMLRACKTGGMCEIEIGGSVMQSATGRLV